MGWLVNATPRPLYPRERDPVPIVQEAGWVPGPVCGRVEKYRPHRDSIPGQSSPLQVDNYKTAAIIIIIISSSSIIISISISII
jgi:hypothetical protein